MQLNAVEITLFADQLQAVCEEMGQVLQLSAYSPNIRERRDFSAALFDQSGDLVAQGRNIPVHLGSMSTAVRALITAAARRGEPLGRDDVLLVNDPFEGGTHLPDITAVAPYFADGDKVAPVAFLAARAHHADVGGMSSGSLPMSSELYQEGLVIPPVWLMRAGRLQQDVLSLLCANSRTPQERRGDLMAQLASLRRGEQRLNEVTASGSAAISPAVFAELQSHSARALRGLIQDLPRSQVNAADCLELGSELVWIRLTFESRAQELVFDFSASDDQVAGPLNAVRAITVSAVFYLLRCLLSAEVPTTAGLLRPVRIITRPGSIVDALPPAAVAGGNVETSKRIVDVLLQAWARLDPARAVAASQGTMNNLTVGGQDERWDQRRPFAYYETIGGGHGAAAGGAGLSGRHCHMTNSLNTPIEALEHAYPLRIWRYALRRASGGDGRCRGGDGLLREIELLIAAEATVLSQRRRRGAPGVSGGEAGQAGRNRVLSSGVGRDVAGIFSRRFNRGDRLCIETPGGGGCGRPV